MVLGTDENMLRCSGRPGKAHSVAMALERFIHILSDEPQGKLPEHA